ncbi:hypothetical protein VUR80DRAFT_2622 [Thermomyces stellatus]
MIAGSLRATESATPFARVVLLLASRHFGPGLVHLGIWGSAVAHSLARRSSAAGQTMAGLEYPCEPWLMPTLGQQSRNTLDRSFDRSHLMAVASAAAPHSWALAVSTSLPLLFAFSFVSVFPRICLESPYPLIACIEILRIRERGKKKKDFAFAVTAVAELGLAVLFVHRATLAQKRRMGFSLVPEWIRSMTHRRGRWVTELHRFPPAQSDEYSIVPKSGHGGELQSPQAS